MSRSRSVIREHMALTKPIYEMPKSVQQTVPICKISEDGIFLLEPDQPGTNKRYDKAYLFWDTNYTSLNPEEREDFQRIYVSFLNSLNVSFKILVVNAKRDLKEMQREIFLKDRTREHQEVVDAYNEIIEEKLLRGRNGIEQLRVFLLTCSVQDYQAAFEFFKTIEANIKMNFQRMSSRLIPLNAEERLRLLHNLYRIGREEEYHFDYLEALKKGRDFRNDICPASIQDNKDQYGRPDGSSLMIDDQFVRVLYAREYPSSLTDEYIRTLTDVSFPCVITMDYAPIPLSVARKRLYDLYMKTEQAVIREQEVHNRNGNFSSNISYDKRKQQEKIETALDLISENDEKMSYFGLYIVVWGNSYEELINNVLTMTTISEGVGMELYPAMYNQLPAFNTCLPVGVRYCQYMRTVFSSNLCAFMPFNVLEIQDAGGLFYGINAISKNPIIGDRKKLPNGNGVIYGSTGAGKSVKAKAEMGQVLIHTLDDLVVIDPHNEYRDLCEYFRGQFLNIGNVGKTHVNPFSTDGYEYYESAQAFLFDKVSLCQTIVGQMLERDLSSEQKSLVVRCTEEIYQPFLSARKKGQSVKAPTISDLYEAFLRQPEPESRALAMAVERFRSGALNVFDGQTNVDVNNRFVVYGLQDLGEALFGVGIIVMLEQIRTRIAQNFKRGIATWIYVDEFHVLSKYDASAKYLDKIWREVRKNGGLITGIDQKFSEMLQNETVETMLSNSSYIALLGQADAEIAYIQKIMPMNENELDMLRQAVPGCGLTKWGEKIIPTEFILPKKNFLYTLFNTNFHEINRKKPKKKQIRKAAENLLSDAREEAAGLSPAREPKRGAFLNSKEVMERIKNGGE